jgi:hypothetical protein
LRRPPLLTCRTPVSGRSEDRDRQNRPRHVDIEITDTNGRTTTFPVELEDGTVQRIATPVDDATQVTLRLRSAYIAGRDGRSRSPRCN